MTTELLVLKRALASLAFGEWHGEDYDVLANGVVVGRIFTSLVAPKDAPWFWSLARSRFESETDERQRRDVRRSDGRIRQELATVSERMLARLGHLGYWLGCGLAVVALVSGCTSSSTASTRIGGGLSMSPLSEAPLRVG